MIEQKRTLIPNYLIFGGIILFLLGLVVFYNLNPEKIKIYPICLFYRLTGMYCPGCGGTRATYWLLHGNLGKALHYNAVYVIALPFFMVFGFSKICRDIFNKEIMNPRIRSAVISRKLYYITLGIIILFWILRNLPIDPFKVLAP